MADHMTMHISAPDTRKVLDWTATMRAHLLTNMRGHLETLSQLMAALSAAPAALSHVVENCGACHAAYRLK